MKTTVKILYLSTATGCYFLLCVLLIFRQIKSTVIWLTWLVHLNLMIWFANQSQLIMPSAGMQQADKVGKMLDIKYDIHRATHFVHMVKPKSEMSLNVSKSEIIRLIRGSRDWHFGIERSPGKRTTGHKQRKSCVIEPIVGCLFYCKAKRKEKLKDWSRCLGLICKPATCLMISAATGGTSKPAKLPSWQFFHVAGEDAV